MKLGKITKFEILLIVVFLAFLFLSIISGMAFLENVLLFVGFAIGLTSLIFIARLGRNYLENKKEIRTWTIRFLVFKFFPFALYFIRW